MNSNVARVIASYVRLVSLKAFFVRHNVNFGLKFSYDVSDSCISLVQFEDFFGDFENVVIVGANNLIEMDEKRLYHVRRMKIETFRKRHDELYLCNKLKMLKVLMIKKMCEIDIFPPMTLRVLVLGDCLHLRDLYCLVQCVNLREITLNGCKNLADIKTLGVFGKLRKIWMSECKVSSLPKLSKYLRVVKFVKCSELRDIVGINECKRIEVISLEKCGVEKVVGCNWPNLIDANFNNCYKLMSIEGLRGCHKLETIDVGRCGKLQSLNGLSHLSLRNIDMYLCNSVTNIDPIVGCRGLKRINIAGCYKITKIPSVEWYGICDVAMNCLNIETIDNIRVCRGLKLLDVTGCNNLTHFPELSVCELEYVNMTNCYKVNSIIPLLMCGTVRGICVDGCREDLEKYLVDVCDKVIIQNKFRESRNLILGLED